MDTNKSNSIYLVRPACVVCCESERQYFTESSPNRKRNCCSCGELLYCVMKDYWSISQCGWLKEVKCFWVSRGHGQTSVLDWHGVRREAVCPAVSVAGSRADPAARGGGGRGGSLPHREVLPDESTGREANRSAASKRSCPSNECM